jgi:hypothetical protein
MVHIHVNASVQRATGLRHAATEHSRGKRGGAGLGFEQVDEGSLGWRHGHGLHPQDEVMRRML